MPNEDSPLLSLGGKTNAEKNWGKIRNVTRASMAFRRVAASKTRRPSLGKQKRMSVRVGHEFPSEHTEDDEQHLEPADALAPLVAGGVIKTTDGYKTESRPASSVKSLPAFAPFRRKARHRSFYLWWINEFRHWWKSSRLLVRLAGLFTLAFTLDYIDKMTSMDPSRHKHKVIAKNASKAVKIVKKLGRGGPMHHFLSYVHVFTRSLRILVAAWRWIEAAQCRRGEVGVEEAMAFIGNRVSRMLARTAVDSLVLYIVMPCVSHIFKNHWLPADAWHPMALFIVLGIIRACAPYAASFQGSRVGRVLTREFYRSSKHRWMPIQRVQTLNLTSDDCCERDEVSQTADLARLAKLVAKALGSAQEIGFDGLKGQSEALAEEGFHQVGAGSGGYAVYECHRRVWTDMTKDGGEPMTVLLHVTPYGPSILDVMPRYVVLECEDSADRRGQWSEYISKKVFEGPPVLEGYCYQGAFFSPHHYAELKETYDKQLLAYDRACKAMCKPRTGRSPNPPTDLLSLKAFLADGKLPRKRKKNRREGAHLYKEVEKAAAKLKSMMKGCCAPRGVILYFEGLDCSGKSSTGGLVEQALKLAGFDVDMRQYNRPPTPEQKRKPWMDRFEAPSTTVAAITIKSGEPQDSAKKLLDKCADHAHNAMVWDRGPAGDFVYGKLSEASPEERNARYSEFMAFDREMFEQKILFCKLLFVTNRDSIASTLGKRLAQRKMARDLTTWLKASRGGDSDFGDAGFEGLDEIILHIDPTDFVAFNSYQRNLRIFTNVAMNTDSDENPWLVVNTGDRYSARKQLLRAFSYQLERFKSRHVCSCCQPRTSGSEEAETPGMTEDEMLAKGFTKPWPVSLLLSLAGMLLLIYYYCEHTKFDTLLYLFRGSPSEELDDLGNDTITELGF